MDEDRDTTSAAGEASIPEENPELAPTEAVASPVDAPATASAEGQTPASGGGSGLRTVGEIVLTVVLALGAFWILQTLLQALGIGGG